MGLVQTILIVFGVIAIAYAAAHFKLLDERVGDGLSDFVFMIAAPLLLFRTMVTADFHGAAPWQLWIAYFTGVIVAWAVSDLAIKMIFGRDNRAGVVAGVSGAFSNLVFLGMPLMLGVFGQDGFAILSLIVAIHMPIMMAASITLHELAMRRDGVFEGEGHIALVVLSFFKRFAHPDVGKRCRTGRVVCHGHGAKEIWGFGSCLGVLGHVGNQTIRYARRCAGSRLVHRTAAFNCEDCGYIGRASCRCKLLFDCNPLRERAGAGFEFHGDGHGFVGDHDGILDFDRYPYIRVGEACCSFCQKGAG
jgi:hypothetical protein